MKKLKLLTASLMTLLALSSAPAHADSVWAATNDYTADDDLYWETGIDRMRVTFDPESLGPDWRTLRFKAYNWNGTPNLDLEVAHYIQGVTYINIYDHETAERVYGYVGIDGFSREVDDAGNTWDRVTMSTSDWLEDGAPVDSAEFMFLNGQYYSNNMVQFASTFKGRSRWQTPLPGKVVLPASVSSEYVQEILAVGMGQMMGEQGSLRPVLWKKIKRAVKKATKALSKLSEKDWMQIVTITAAVIMTAYDVVACVGGVYAIAQSGGVATPVAGAETARACTKSFVQIVGITTGAAAADWSWQKQKYKDELSQTNGKLCVSRCTVPSKAAPSGDRPTPMPGPVMNRIPRSLVPIHI